MKKRKIICAALLAMALSSTFTFANTVDLERRIAQINSSIEKANYIGADEVIYKALNVYKDNYELQALAAVSWSLQGKLELAQDCIDKIKNAIPKNSNLHFAQGVVFYKRMNSSNLEYRNKRDSLLDIAHREFKYAVQLDPDNYRAYNALGVVELRRGDVCAAKENIEKALSLAPEYALAIDNLGTVYLAEQNPEKAEECFKKAISINPNCSSAYYHMAQIECDRGNYAKCLTYVNKCLAWKGYSSYAYNLRGDAYRLQGNEAAAIGAYKKAIEITPENLTPYANLAAIYESRKDFELALDAYKTILSVNPASEQTALKIADMYLESGKFEESVAFYDKLNSNLRTEGIKGIASAYYGMAMQSANRASFSSDTKLIEAYDYLNKAIQSNPNDLELYLAKAKISSLINKQSESVMSLNAIIQKKSCSVDDLLTKGDAYAALNDYVSANRQYAAAINSAKSLSDKMYLSEIFTFNKQFDQAEVLLNDILRHDRNNTIAQSNLAYIAKSRKYADEQVKSARYFRIRNSMFFEREYLNRALKADPYNLDANILMGRLNQRQRRYIPAYNNYAIVVSKAKDEKTLNQYTKRLNKMKNKLNKAKPAVVDPNKCARPAQNNYNVKRTVPVSSKKSVINKNIKPASKVNYSPKNMK